MAGLPRNLQNQTIREAKTWSASILLYRGRYDVSILNRKLSMVEQLGAWCLVHGSR
jgi:hypothetical protein